tara:strand:+ start:84342 stop:85211 length:870 start_codon:yes stop_codon:yes gene_type:complete
MKPAPFSFHRPSSISQCLELLQALADGDAKVLAGGQSLIPMMNFRMAQPEALIDLSGIADLEGIRLQDDNLIIGAMSRHNAIKADELVAIHAPLISLAYDHVAHFTIRNRGTLGGNLCHSDPASEMPAVMRVLGAQMEIASADGRRLVSADQFFFGPFATAVEPEELLVAIRIPVSPRGRRYSFHEVSLRKGDFAMSAIAAAVDLDVEGRVMRARIGLCGVSDIALRAENAEEGLVGEYLNLAAATAAADAAVTSIEFNDTAAISASYRRDLTRALIIRALLGCTEERL